MKSLPFYLLAGGFLVFAASARGTKLERVESFAELRGLFQNPPTEYRTVPLWVWNDRITRERIDEQLQALKQQGIGGVFIHPRYGLVTEYLSPTWFKLVSYSVERAKELGMHVWIYDENSYPSGFAGGHVPAEMPDSYEHGQGLVMEVRDSLGAFPNDEWPVVLVRQGDRFRVLENAADAHSATGPYYVFRKVRYPVSKWYAGFSYVDLIYQGVTEKFIQVTMNGYERAVGKEFGKTVRGVFTDEPHIRPPRRNAIRWTPDLFDQFRKMMGYDLRPVLPSLFEDVGEWRKVRHDYRLVLLKLFEERWSKPWHDYCEKHGLLWTGHYWEHSWPDPSESPDCLLMYSYHQIPGIDMLFNRFDEGVNAQFGNIRSVREVASVARQLGRPRVLSETYGGSGWDLTFADMKRLGEWEYVHGVNLMTQHLAFISLRGDRKMDYPVSFSEHEPWWHLYHYMADHFARLSLALSAGRGDNRLLVIEPNSTAWMYARPGMGQRELGPKVGEPFQRLVTQLSHAQVEYDIGSEALLERYGQVRGGRFVVGQAAYDAVILPPGLENLEPATLELLSRFLEAGGKVYSFCGVPAYVAGKHSEACAELMRRHEENWVAFDSLGTKALQTLAEYQPIQFEVSQGKWLFHQRRLLREGQLLFLVNSSMDEPARGQVQLPGETVVVLDPFTGSIQPMAANRENGRVTVTFDLPPIGSLLLFVSAEEKKVDVSVVSGQGESERLAPVSVPTRVVRDSLNVLTLDYCDVSVDTFLARGMYYTRAQDAIWKHHGYPENPWFRGIQFRRQLVEADTFNAVTGFEAVFPFEVKELPRTDRLFVVVEQPQVWDVSVNGTKVKPVEGRYWLDHSFAVYPVAGLLRRGRNEVHIVCRPMSMYAELEAVYVLGDFSLVPAAQGWAIVPARELTFGSWKDQGCPFYGQSVTYSKRVELGQVGRAVVRLGRWAGSVAEVRVNGESAGIIAWPPYELEIGKYLRSGRNEVEVVVYGSLKNTLGPHLVGDVGIAGPWHFRRAPETQPPGIDYRVLPYGLFEDFTIEVSKRAAQ